MRRLRAALSSLLLLTSVFAVAGPAAADAAGEDVAVRLDRRFRR